AGHPLPGGPGAAPAAAAAGERRGLHRRLRLRARHLADRRRPVDRLRDDHRHRAHGGWQVTSPQQQPWSSSPPPQPSPSPSPQFPAPPPQASLSPPSPQSPPPPRRRVFLGRDSTWAERIRVYRTDEALEVVYVSSFQLTMRRVFFDEVQLVTLHRSRGGRLF